MHAQIPDLLNRTHFLAQLHREKRRTDRSKSPLSMAVFRIDGDHGTVTDELRTLLSILNLSKRETDILGFLGHGLAAILLTDTDAPGTQGFLRKIADHGSELRFSVATATYPDHLFDAVLTGNEGPSDFHPLVHHDVPEQRRSGYGIKRMLDVVGASVAIVLLSPVMLVTAVAVATSSPGPIIFKQKRIGRYGKTFVFYKFRSMGHNNNDHMHREFVTSLIQGEHAKVNQGADGQAVVQAQDRSPHYRCWPCDPEDEHRRIAPALQCAEGRHEPRGPASATPLRGREVPVLAPASRPGSAAWDHRPVAGRRSQQDDVRRDGQTGPALHPHLLADDGPADPAAHRQGCGQGRRGNLSIG